MTNPDDTNCVPDSRVMPAGLKKIVEASSAAAASPANALPSPRALCSFTWKPAASTLRASHTMLASTTSRQTIRWRGFGRSGVTARARGVSGARMEPARRAQHADVLGDRRPRIEDGCARDRDRHAGVCEGADVLGVDAAVDLDLDLLEPAPDELRPQPGHRADRRGEGPERRDHERTHAQVGDEVPVHDVDVDAAHARVERVGHLGAEPQEVGGEDRRRYLYGTGAHRSVARSAKRWHQRV